jgi:hypothetical protein
MKILRKIEDKVLPDYIVKHQNFTFFFNLLKIENISLFLLSADMTYYLMCKIFNLPHLDIIAALDIMMDGPKGFM